MARPFTIELIDIPYHARPHIASIDVPATAHRIRMLRKAGGGNRNYDKNVAQIADMATGLARLDHLKAQFADTDDDSWRSQLEEVCERLFSIFGSVPSRWYAVNRKPQELYDRTLFKPAIRGIRVVDGRATAFLLNLRKTMVFDAVTRAFIARGLYEFYLIDDPNLHGFRIVDLGADPKSSARATRVYSPEQVSMMSLERFEDILRNYMAAVEYAGLSARPEAGQSIADLLRRGR